MVPPGSDADQSDKAEAVLVGIFATTREDCHAVEQMLARQSALRIAFTASNLKEARALTVSKKPEAILVVCEHSTSEGFVFLGELKRNWPIPVIVMNHGAEMASDIALTAFQRGARDVVDFPDTRSTATDQVRNARKIAQILWSGLRKGEMPSLPAPRDDRKRGEVISPQPLLRPVSVIVIGSSTGGMRSIGRFLDHLPGHGPPIIIAQHIKPGYIVRGAQRMDRYYDHNIGVAHDGEVLRSNQVRFAPDSHHLRVEERGGAPVVFWTDPAESDHFVPSADVLMSTAAEAFGSRAVGVILTGMGKDGSKGMVQLRQLGARCLGECEESCVVYGMPKAAMEAGGVELEFTAERLGSYVGELVQVSGRALIPGRPGSDLRPAAGDI